MSHKSIHVVTLGCSKNLVDSEVLLRQIEANGLTVYHNADSCDARTVIINTCGFIRDAKQESIDTILRFIRAREEGLLDHVFVMGCLSERYKKELEHEIPDVDKYFGVNDLGEIIKTLGLDLKHALLGERYLTTPAHYAFLKISEGCDRKCAFCAIPLIRGRHRSVPPEMLLQQAGYLAGRGVKELILIAQDLTWYGIDLNKRQMLPELLRDLSEVKGIEWIRLHYAYPAKFPREVIQVMKERENICRYLDIPFQHNYDAVLRKMNRGHNQQQNLELIDFIRREIPDITLRTTLITGFPGETEKAYSVLREFVEQVQFDRLGVFTYSEEENTPAAQKYSDSIPEKTKHERADELMDIQQGISTMLNNRKIGKSFKVLIDTKDSEYYLGRTEGDSPEIDNEVLLPLNARPLAEGQFYTVKITGAEAFDLMGEVI
ncbi:MAG: 30S ribosomal protein S12 methylthiotransferase RimO [Bacteroidales bacterium]|nr:30S ribosomal protein S12 methylthiotransferase RimO [Bacteroidales bacterium]